MQGMPLIAILLIAGTLFGQTGQVSQIVDPRGSIAPSPSLGPSISLIDNNGSLAVFDTTYTYTRPASDQNGRVVRISPVVTIKTKVTIIPTDQTLRPTTQEYDSAFQVIGAGKFAVYAMVNGKLIAINVLPGSALPLLAQFPSVDAGFRGEVRLSPSKSGEPDTIFSVDPAANLPQTMNAVVPERFARSVKFNGQFSVVTRTKLP